MCLIKIITKIIPNTSLCSRSLLNMKEGICLYIRYAVFTSTYAHVITAIILHIYIPIFLLCLVISWRNIDSSRSVTIIISDGCRVIKNLLLFLLHNLLLNLLRLLVILMTRLLFIVIIVIAIIFNLSISWNIVILIVTRYLVVIILYRLLFIFPK